MMCFYSFVYEEEKTEEENWNRAMLTIGPETRCNGVAYRPYSENTPCVFLPLLYAHFSRVMPRTK